MHNFKTFVIFQMILEIMELEIKIFYEKLKLNGRL